MNPRRMPAELDKYGQPGQRSLLLSRGGRPLLSTFYPSAEVPWSLSLAAPDLTAGSQDQVSGAVASVAAHFTVTAPGPATATAH
jgi:hypothetical protein